MLLLGMLKVGGVRDSKPVTPASKQWARLSPGIYWS
ncbi:uncharacterized protein METZ01_LOCUS191530 [marine metagenome]|uniref:Uncharacterized protein n=1 Tax=marine metagenome TaxID=408172 RepID=A0A382DJM1_9ZZZZ